MSDGPAKCIRTLESRLDYLENHLEANTGSAGALDYRRGEAKALRWALPILRREQELIHESAHTKNPRPPKTQ